MSKPQNISLILWILVIGGLFVVDMFQIVLQLIPVLGWAFAKLIGIGTGFWFSLWLTWNGLMTFRRGMWILGFGAAESLPFVPTSEAFVLWSFGAAAIMVMVKYRNKIPTLLKLDRFLTKARNYTSIRRSRRQGVGVGNATTI